MKNKPYFPMFIDLSDKNIVVVGGGNIATRRVKTLLSFTRNIRVIAPKVTMEMMELGEAGYVELITRPVKRTDFAMAYMVIAATNDRKLNDEIHRICRQEGVYVNVASDRGQLSQPADTHRRRKNVPAPMLPADREPSTF